MTEPRRETSGIRRSVWLGEGGLLIVCVLALVVGAATFDRVAGSVVFVISAAACTAVVGWAWYRDEVSTTEVLIFAVIARLVAFPLLPTLSDDGFRYIWDGILQIHSFNPYLFRPSDEALAVFQASELYANLNSQNYYSVYPPSSQILFWFGGIAAAGISWEAGWYVIKAAFVVIELAGLWAASRLVSSRHLVLYAWHPLTIIEGAGQGHTDVAMVGAIFLCIFAYRRGFSNLAVAALTIAGWFKLYPLVLLPFLLNRVGWKTVWVAVVTSALLWVPYATMAVPSRMLQSLELYTQLFEFNAGPYFLLKEIGFELTGTDVSKTLGPLLQQAFIILISIGWITHLLKRTGVAWSWLIALGLFWATATTVHPWYLLGTLVLVPLALEDQRDLPSRLYSAAWIWLCTASLGTYLLYAENIVAYWFFVIAGWSGWTFFVASALLVASLAALMRQRAVDKWQWIRLHLGDSLYRLLDLGAGDGYVAVEAAKETHAHVVLADVVDFNKTDLPLELYDGVELPFSDGTFDATLLLYVLHHCEDAQAVLREAHRVTTKRVVVLESIIETKWDYRWLNVADRTVNWLRSGGKMREQSLHFDTLQGWRDRFAAAGFIVVSEDRRGHMLHKRHLFVLERAVIGI